MLCVIGSHDPDVSGGKDDNDFFSLMPKHVYKYRIFTISTFILETSEYT
jgi:hypothetical protein